MSFHSEISQVIPPLNEHDHLQGSPQSSLVLMEYEDYQCPQCQRANELVKAIQQQLADQFCFVFRHFPLRA
ncbi:MAG: DsbA family protein [Phormidesmis sp.]